VARRLPPLRRRAGHPVHRLHRGRVGGREARGERAVGDAATVSDASPL
ncbi:MAG: hypothetical protein AVDCRST_MAG19-1415, partial [uncultured Thermomicrobiales bacterium]